MTDSTWKKVLVVFEENQKRFSEIGPFEPMPSARLCRESGHRTLGHLTACQEAWLPIMRGLRDGAERAVVPINPDPLFRKLGFSTLPWEALLDQFISDRAEWRSILEQVDVRREIRTSKRVHTAQTLTRRMVEHERRHIDQIPLGR